VFALLVPDSAEQNDRIVTRLAAISTLFGVA